MFTTNRQPLIYPKHLALYDPAYGGCPERFFHERIERRRVEQPFSPHLHKAILGHGLLSEAAVEYARKGTVPADLRQRIAARYPRGPYPTDTAWQLDCDDLYAQVTFAMGEVLDGETEVLATEAEYWYRYTRGEGCPSFILATKIDLVRRCRDALNRPFLDIVDYRFSSGGHPDELQDFAAWLVVKKNIDTIASGDVAFVRNSTVFTGSRRVEQTVLDHEECVRRWREVQRIVGAMIADQEHRPAPSPRCEWCPYFENGCSLTQEDEEDGDDALGDLLDGAAD